MDEHDEPNICHLHWRIENPFLPWRRFDAIFYHGSGSPFFTEWKASIVPLAEKESFDTKAFLFYLESRQSSARAGTIPVETLSIEILLNERNVEERELPEYSFCKGNLWAYQYPKIVFLFPTETTDCLEINIGMTFRSEKFVAKEERELVFFRRDLTELSKDLERLLRSRCYTDLRLTSKDPVSDFSVHSDILRARWSNFFTKHPGSNVKTGISERVLSDILTYIYSGTSKIMQSSDDESAMHELFQVIDKYRLHHLYKTFIGDDSEQERLTVQEGKKSEIEYLLYDRSKGLPIKEAKYRWDVFPSDTIYEFELDLHFLLSRDPPSFSYTLQSRSTRKIFAKLTFEFVERVESGLNFEVFHAKEFEFEPYGTEKSGPLYFEDSEALKGYRESWNLEPNLKEARHSIRCILSLGIGKTTERLCATDGEYIFQDEMEGLNVLSDHMSKCLNQLHNQDFTVVCPAEKANNGEESHLLHKAIFAARVPNYWAVLEGVEEGSEIPNEARCTLSSEAFRYVLQYIYTGKVFRIPEILLHEVGNFADKGKLQSLKTLVDNIKKQCY